MREMLEAKVPEVSLSRRDPEILTAPVEKVAGLGPAMRTGKLHILTVDVEDYFMVEAFADKIPHHMWSYWPSRIVPSMQRLLELLDEYAVHATFFFVGWIADRFPKLVREVILHGHEVACHSYWHRPVYSLSPEEFRKDTVLALQVIENAAGTKVHGYRAPSWSIDSRCLWALEILAEEGFEYDSSIYPIRHDLYGFPGSPRYSYCHQCQSGLLREFPAPTVNLFGTTLPGGGGGYLRIFPLAYTRWVFKQFAEASGQAMVVYVHPWELDPDQPRIRAKLKSRLRHYTNLNSMEKRVRYVLRNYSFESAQGVMHKQPLIGTFPLLKTGIQAVSSIEGIALP